MKKYLFLVILLRAGLAIAQPTNRANGQLFFQLENEKQKLQQFVGHVTTASGIFQRVIQKIDVDITATYSKHHRFSPYLELNYIHLKFYDFDTIRYDVNMTPYTIGKVFMSERYVESDYFDLFRKPVDYRHDRDGFYYYCKVYFDTKSLEQRLIIYPKYLVNICDKYMHLNDEFCSANDIEPHDNTIRSLIAIPDTDYDDFISENSFISLRQRKDRAKQELFNFAMKDSANRVEVHRLFAQREVTSPSQIKNYNAFFTHQIRKNTLPVFVNYAKYMKIFRIIPTDTTGRYEGTKLTLIHSKRANNEDFTDNLAYDFSFHAYANNPLSETISEYVEYTQNAGNRRLVYSEKPDDEFITGKKRVFNPISFYTQNLQGIDSCRNNGKGYITCLSKLQLAKENELNRVEREISTAKTRLDTALAIQRALVGTEEVHTTRHF